MNDRVIDSIELKNKELAEVLDISHQEQKNLRDAIVAKELASDENTIEQSIDYISDKEKLKKIWNFVKKMHDILLGMWSDRIVSKDYILQRETALWWWGFVKWTLTDTKGNTLFIFEVEYDPMQDKFPVISTTKIGNKILYYNGDDNNGKWIYKNYGHLEQAQQYQTIIDAMIKENKWSTNKNKK